MARFFLLCLSAACCCCLAALLLPPVQGRPGPVTGAGGRDDRLLFPEPHFDAAQQGGVAMKKATLSSRSLPAPMATAAGGDVVTPELRTVPGGDANPSHGSIRQERTSPAEAVAAAGSAARPELRTTPWGSNPLHNR